MIGAENDLWLSLPIPAILVDGQNEIRDINPAAEGFMNASSKSLRGVPLWDHLNVDAPIEAAFARARSGNTTLSVNDVDVGTGARPPRQSNLQIAPYSGADGHMLVLITPREMAGRMTQGNAVKSAAKSAIGMAEMLTHEIKNPLAGITGAAQLVSMNLRGDDLELTDLIVAESRRIVRLLDQVEQFGNLSPPDLAPVNLHDVLDRARRSALVGFGAHMTISEDYDPSLPLAYGDLDQLVQVVLNLLKNAAQAAGEAGGTIRLRSFYEHSYRLQRATQQDAAMGMAGLVGKQSSAAARPLPLQIEIVDDGPGIAPELLNDIFDPFISGRENGTGLGLALVSKIMSDHGGWITVTSVPSRTVFRLSLPMVPKSIMAKNLKDPEIKEAR